MSQVIPRSAHKSSISWVSAIPPIKGTRQLTAWRNQLGEVHWDSLRWKSHDDERAIALKQSKISVEIVRRRNAVDDEIKAFLLFLHRVFILGTDDLARTQPSRIVALTRRSSEERDLGSESAGKI